MRQFRAEKGAHWWFFLLVLQTGLFAKGRRFLEYSGLEDVWILRPPIVSVHKFPFS